MLASTCHGAVGCQDEYSMRERRIFSRKLLLSLRSSISLAVPTGIPDEIYTEQKANEAPTRTPRRRKRGRRGGLCRRLKRLSLDNRRRLLPLPTVLLANVQSIRNKIDKLEAWVKCISEIGETSHLAFTKTWLSEADKDEELIISGFSSPLRLDRSPEITGKNRGGGMCLFVNKRYCNTVVVREKLSTPDIELLSVSLRPHYLPREFQQLFYTLAYIHPRANAAQLIEDVTH